MASYAQIDQEEMQFVQEAAAEGFARSLQLMGLDAEPLSANVIYIGGVNLPSGGVVSCYPNIFHIPVEDEKNIDLEQLVLAVKTAIDSQRWMQRQLPLFKELELDEDGHPVHVDYYK